MNNYSWLQQKLHKIALSSKFLREVAFDVESSIIPTNQTHDNNVFVAGLARSGSTILLNALYESNNFASLSYQDMPFVLAPNLWSKINLINEETNLIERAHGDGIKVSSKSPEAFEEVFWMTFREVDEETERKFKLYVELIKKKYKKERYLSKNNQNIRRIKLISKFFPNSKILIPFRDPIQHSYSLLSQHRRFIEFFQKDKFVSNYMKWIGHTEFGPNYKPIHEKNLTFQDDMTINHWLEQWYLAYLNIYKTLKDENIIYFISHEKLCSSKEYWMNILRLLDIKKTYEYEFKNLQKDIHLEVDINISNKCNDLYLNLSELNI